MEGKNQEQLKPRTKVEVLKGILSAESVQMQFQNALKDNSGTFIASLIDVYNSDKGLQECEPRQIVSEALKAAVLKLAISKELGFAYLVKFNVKGKPTPTLVIGYKGLIQLAIRSGLYKTINADIVYEGELIEDKSDKLTGALYFTGKRKSDKVVGYFAYIELLTGFRKTFYMPLDKVARYAKRYSPSLKYSKLTINQLMASAGTEAVGYGWEGGFDDMAQKTVLRQLLSKYGLLSVEMQSAISQDIASENLAPENGTNKIIDIESEEIKPEAKQTEEDDSEKVVVPPYAQ